jgi:quercetin dioxygenase-like cupin family protein
MADRIVIRCTAEETGGEAVVVEVVLAAGGATRSFGRGAGQERRFEVISGEVAFELAGTTRIAGAGERLTLAAGVEHRFWNAGGEEAQFVCEVRPALDFEQRVESFVNSGRST